MYKFCLYHSHSHEVQTVSKVTITDNRANKKRVYDFTSSVQKIPIKFCWTEKSGIFFHTERKKMGIENDGWLVYMFIVMLSIYYLFFFFFSLEIG